MPFLVNRSGLGLKPLLEVRFDHRLWFRFRFRFRLGLRLRFRFGLGLRFRFWFRLGLRLRFRFGFRLELGLWFRFGLGLRRGLHRGLDRTLSGFKTKFGLGNRLHRQLRLRVTSRKPFGLVNVHRLVDEHRLLFGLRCVIRRERIRHRLGKGVIVIGRGHHDIEPGEIIARDQGLVLSLREGVEAHEGHDIVFGIKGNRYRLHLLVARHLGPEGLLGIRRLLGHFAGLILAHMLLGLVVAIILLFVIRGRS